MFRVLYRERKKNIRETFGRRESFSLFIKKTRARAQNTRDNNTLSSREEVAAILDERTPRVLRTPLYPLPKASFSSFCRYRLFVTALDTFILAQKGLGAVAFCVCAWSCRGLWTTRERERETREKSDTNARFPNEFRTRFGARASSGIIALTTRERDSRIFFLEFALLGVGVTSSLQREHVVVVEEEEKPQEEEKANNNNNNHAGKQRTRWERIMANRDGSSGYIW